MYFIYREMPLHQRDLDLEFSKRESLFARDTDPSLEARSIFEDTKHRDLTVLGHPIFNFTSSNEKNVGFP